MRKAIVFKLNQETLIPLGAIEGMPLSGACDSYISDIQQVYSVDVSLEDSKAYLSSYGAWDDTELSDLQSNKDRLLWLALSDCKERGDQFFYMGA